MTMLPISLLCLISSILSANAQSRTSLSLNKVASFTSQTSLLIPAQDELTITVALCSSSTPRFFISNNTDSAIEDDPGPDGGEGVHEILLQDGFGNWAGGFPNGGILAVEGLPPGGSFEVGVSNDGPLHQILADPLFGDSTSNQAIIFSPIFENLPSSPKLNYPNYTLPIANTSRPDSPSSSPNFTLVVSRTSSTRLLRTACFLNSSAVSATGTVVSSSPWMRGPLDGWRNEWLVRGLVPSTNYTAFVIQDTLKVSGPLNFVTKSASFACTLVHALPYCPSTAYSLPLPAPPGSDFPIYDSSNIPEPISSLLISTMMNFTTSLSTFACGRDWYSPLVGCDDCQREYRKWLCTMLFPRCSEASPSNVAFITPNPSSTGIVNAGATEIKPTPTAQAVLSALLPVSSQQVVGNRPLPYMSSAFTKLLPCIETCTAVDRACPPFLGFRCPSAKFNGASSYGIGYIDGARGDEGEGVTGMAQDRWGNVWCNAG